MYTCILFSLSNVHWHFCAQIQASLNRIRANKKSLTTVDDDLEDTISSVKRRARIDLGEKLDGASSSSGAVRATLKVSNIIWFLFSHLRISQQNEKSCFVDKKAQHFIDDLSFSSYPVPLQVVTRRQEVEPVAHTTNLLKWTKLTSDAESQSSSASLRAQASKARLQELESDICERSEKQLAREKRSAQLKQFLLDSDIETSTRADRRYE